MIRQDRFLTFILIGIFLLILLSLGVYFTRQRGLEYGEEVSPSGVVRNYVIALLKGDYARAYRYLKEGEFKPTEDQFRQAFLTRQPDLRSVALQIGKEKVEKESATVELILIRNANDPFGNSFTENGTGSLRKDADGKWKIENLPYPYWNWDWYNAPLPTPEPLPIPEGQD